MRIRAFSAIRPNQEDAAQVASVPYDVVTSEEARQLAAANPKSFLHVSRPEIDLPGVLPTSPEAYAHSRAMFDRLIASGALKDDSEAKFFAYRLTMGSHAQTGIVATFDTQEYLEGVIKRHETTRVEKEDDRLRHIEVLEAHTGLAYLTYRDDPAIDLIVRDACRGEPLYRFVASTGVEHAIWEIGPATACASDELIELFARIPAAYIADGHHRTAAAARYAQAHDFAGESRWFPAVIFPTSQLRILPYNRLVRSLNDLSDYEFLSRVSANFTIGGTGRRSCRMYFRGAWRSLSWTEETSADPSTALDVAYLQKHLLGGVLGIDDPRTDPRIDFLGGIHGEDELARRVDSGEFELAFSMAPVSITDIMSIADAGGVMPPKSTWFEPKLASGLFIHRVS